MPKKYWFCSSRVEQWAVNSKVVGSNPTRIATDFVAQLERVFAYEAKGWRFESFQNHTSSLERNKAYWGYWLTFPTVSREKRVRSPYKPQLTDLLISYIWEDNDWLFTCFGCRRLQVRVFFPDKMEVRQSRRVGAVCKTVVLWLSRFESYYFHKLFFSTQFNCAVGFESLFSNKEIVLWIWK